MTRYSMKAAEESDISREAVYWLFSPDILLSNTSDAIIFFFNAPFHLKSSQAERGIFSEGIVANKGPGPIMGQDSMYNRVIKSRGERSR